MYWHIVFGVTNLALVSVLPSEFPPVRIMDTVWTGTVSVQDDLTTSAALCYGVVIVDKR